MVSEKLLRTIPTVRSASTYHSNRHIGSCILNIVATTRTTAGCNEMFRFIWNKNWPNGFPLAQHGYYRGKGNVTGTQWFDVTELSVRKRGAPVWLRSLRIERWTQDLIIVPMADGQKLTETYELLTLIWSIISTANDLFASS